MSLLFKALAGRNAAVEIGASYRRRGAGAFVETAQVVAVMPDNMGIPHVRFQLRVGGGPCAPVIENRILSLEAFSARYRERVR